MALLRFITLFALLVGVLCQGSIDDRLDCVLVEGSITEQECKNRGCIWEQAKFVPVPWCYLDKKNIGYTVSGKVNHPNGFESSLTLKPTAQKETPFEQISHLKFTATHVSENILRIKITDPNHKRYEVPIQSGFHIPTATPSKTSYEVTLADDFHLVVTRKGTATKIIDTSIGGLVYGDQLIQFATYLASKDVYGFGENYHLSFKRNFDHNYTTLPMFARDYGVGDKNMNYYGHHPFFTVVENDGKAHGIFLLNSNAQSYTLLPAPAVNLKMVGGILDLFIFVGDNPEHVVQLYTSIIGRPVMPPFWGLGFQQCRWGYKNTEDVKKIVKRTLDNNVPLDVQYMDIDYMDEYRDFTYSHKNFADLPKFIEDSKSQNNLRWTLILDPAIQADHKPYNVFEEGYKHDVFIKWPKDLANSTKIGHPNNVPTDKGVLYGKVWPNGPAAFPDFFKNATVQWWKDMIKQMHKDLKFDALWIDMNEPSNFDDANFYKCPADKYQFTHPQMKFSQSLNSKTVCMNALQGEHGEYLHYDVHSLYGWSESRPTLEGLHEATGKRGFVVSRSTYPSSGKYAAHWLGDNVANWEQLRQSIIGMMEFSLFGISFTGADICGFNGRTNPELCRRWFQLGAYYPFSRSHNTIGEQDQDPGYWAENGHAEVTKAAADALRTRYQLLHYLYTSFYRSHVWGDTVVRPVHHQFPHDTAARSIDQQFFLGSAIMVNPFLHEHQTSLNAYVPDGSEWYRMSHDFVEKVHATSGHVSFDDSESHRPLLFKAGSILPVVAEHDLPKVVNTHNLRQVPIELWVLPSSNGAAQGDLFYDDGESINTIELGHYIHYVFKLDKCHLSLEVTHSGYQPPAGSKDILKVSTINVALNKSISGDLVKVSLNENVSLKSSIANNALKISLAESLDLLKPKGMVSIAFANKNTGECFH